VVTTLFGGSPVVEVTALATLCVIAHQLVKFLLAKGTRVDAETLERIDRLEARVEELSHELSRERHLKHEAMAQSATYLGTLRVVRHMVDVVVDSADLPPILKPLLANVP
jgi:hypothetical protein